MRWVVRTGNNSMVTGRTGSRAGDGDVQPYERSVDDPAPTVDCGAGSKWAITRPATTINCDPRVTSPGAQDRKGGQRQFDENSIKITVQEAGLLQSFRRDYPWQGSLRKQHEQVGNAMPPLLGAAVLGHLLGIDGWQDVCRTWHRPNADGAVA